MKRTLSAGGVVLNPKNQVLVVNQLGTSWSLPKGHLDPGETALEAAKREILEESGVQELRLIKSLGSYERHRIGLNVLEDDLSELKVIEIFLFKTEQEALKPQDPDNPEARWVKADEVSALLTHPKDKAFFVKIMPELGIRI
jgi:ADP-ribose pyrophosphatase YjhB (NUDIX family)